MTKSDPYSLDGLVLRFQERMGGHVGIDEPEPLAGSARGQRENTPLQFDVEIRIEDLGASCASPTMRRDFRAM